MSKSKMFTANAYAGAGGQSLLLGFSLQKIWLLDKKRLWSVSAGLRSSSLLLDQQKLSIREAKEGELSAWKAGGYLGNLNVMVQSQIKVWRNYGVGVNFDLAGIGFQHEIALSYPYACTACRVAAAEPATTQRWNILLGPHKDYGSLNSEFFVFSQLTTDLQIRAGWAHYFVQVRYGAEPLFYQAYPNFGFMAISVDF